MFKGFAQGDGTNIKLISKIIEEKLKIPCAVLMGANLANEVAEEHFCETTIGKLSFIEFSWIDFTDHYKNYKNC